MTTAPPIPKKNYKTHRFHPATSLAFEDLMRGMERREFAKTQRVRKVTPDEAMQFLVELPEVKEIRAHAARAIDL